ncbi:MAG: type II toxin-antitoxin system VapB family antitoxin [Dehalococcoidia bacterium]|nr:type II toxin-antitoxin system VapB family antitoxin [Dehalococcoidia bacterium]
MRTTISIDDDLLAEAKAIAARSGRTLNAVVEDALREAFARRRASKRERRVAEFPTFYGGGGLRPGVDLDDSASLLEIMDDDEEYRP